MVHVQDSPITASGNYIRRSVDELKTAGRLIKLKADVIGVLESLGFALDEIYALVIPQRTLARRRKSGATLTVDESDKALRLMRVMEEGMRVFADQNKAQGWLRRPCRALGGKKPIDLLQSETGARLVENELMRIDHGIFA